MRSYSNEIIKCNENLLQFKPFMYDNTEEKEKEILKMFPT